MANEYKPSVGVQGGLYPMGNFKPFNALHVYQPTAEALPANGRAEVGIMYFLGEITTLSVGFPSTAHRGEMVYLSFSTGATAPKVTFRTSNHIGFDTDFTTGRCYEVMGVWDGARWVFVVHEVTL